jgi:hypothetical protein
MWLSIKNSNKGWRCGSSLPSKQKALSSNPSTAIKQNLLKTETTITDKTAQKSMKKRNSFPLL